MNGLSHNADGERIMVSTMDKMADNHKFRYKWAIRQLRELGATTAIDAACGVGYGSLLAIERGFDKVYSFDRDAAVIPYQKKFDHPNIEFTLGDLEKILLPRADAAISIETIEHLEMDAAFVRQLRKQCRFLAATVPNENVVHFDPRVYKWHHRHYTKEQFDNLLTWCGWKVLGWYTQYEKWNRARAFMRPGDDGMTLGVICQ